MNDGEVPEGAKPTPLTQAPQSVNDESSEPKQFFKPEDSWVNLNAIKTQHTEHVLQFFEKNSSWRLQIGGEHGYTDLTLKKEEKEGD